MRKAVFQKTLLVLTLLLGQWLVAAHGFQHSAASADTLCTICVHAQGLDSGAVAPVAALPVLAAAVEAPFITLPALRAAVALRNTPIRGPPSSFV